ncbi:hypothetical protein GCM10011344_16070 [Dokdonia pacifica]|uniref:Uncharacterized protein n=1 Tax=Dokdonia pacifica TaxID=1627892 RepID=A0A238VZH0_9FLAO|nr:hypothetical protein [Dokdonia pacifica]GGG16292.1 hypothetical protein GCM10011344_16070 [Dokdonia pacifica]SNR39628.1 hypothetical protein SAMN06265376_101535 [Dokdonia pacifica]
MEEDIIDISEQLQCSLCTAAMEENYIFCISCGYPEKGSEEEQTKFHAHRILNMRKSSDARQGITSARNILFIIAAINMLWGIFYFFQNSQDISLLIYFPILSVMYLVLGYWSQQKPLMALVLGLLVYLTVIVLGAIYEPESIISVSGLFLKSFVIIYLAKGINAALHIKKS